MQRRRRALFGDGGSRGLAPLEPYSEHDEDDDVMSSMRDHYAHGLTSLLDEPEETPVAAERHSGSVVAGTSNRMTLTVHLRLPKPASNAASAQPDGFRRRSGVSAEITPCFESPIGSRLLRQTLCEASKLTSTA